MNDDHYQELKTSLESNTKITREIYLAIAGTLEGRKGLNTRVGDLENTVDGPDGQPQRGLKHKVEEFDNTRTKIISYVGGGVAVITALWFIWDKIFQQKIPTF